MKRPIDRRVLSVLVAVATAAALAACDTGDGKTLKNTVVPTTLPPPDTTPVESQPIDSLPSEPGIDGSARPVIPTEAVDGPMELTGPWNDGAPIDALYTCDGDDISPALSWQVVPDGTVELALVVTDDDAGTPDEPFVHWIVAGFDPQSISLLEDDVPVGAVQATNSFGAIGWSGPCPPLGDEPHVYRFVLHALAQQIELADGAPADEAMAYLDDLTIARADLTGTFGR